MIDAYESVIRTLQEALAKDTDEARRAAAKGWRVFKATEPDAKGNIVYVHVFLPAVPGFDYRPSLLIDALVKDLAPDLLTQVPGIDRRRAQQAESHRARQHGGGAGAGPRRRRSPAGR